MTNYPERGIRQGHVAQFKFWGPDHIFTMDKARHFKFGVQN